VLIEIFDILFWRKS